MHILVVDDFVLVELALAQVIQDTSHTLTGVRDPRSLPEVLGQGPRFDLALVDINFGPGVPTGLTAMRILRDLSPETKIVIESTDEERNRLLFLLASFSFFEPLALMSKAAPAQAMRALIDAVDRGELTGPGFAGPNGVQDRGRGWTSESLVERLIRNSGTLDELIRNHTELLLWRALVRFDKRGEVARAAHVDERTVDRFMASKSHELLAASGATQVFETFSSWDWFGATHVFGTCRMGPDPRDCVVDSFGRSHRWRNLWIADASVFPSSGGGEAPSLTIHALALRTAEQIGSG